MNVFHAWTLGSRYQRAMSIFKLPKPRKRWLRTCWSQRHWNYWVSLCLSTCTSLTLNVIWDGVSALQMNSARRMNQRRMKLQSKQVCAPSGRSSCSLYVVSEKLPTLFLSVSARCVNNIFLFSRIRCRIWVYGTNFLPRQQFRGSYMEYRVSSG